ncbi:dystroglycan-like isoform X2 [Trichogramma pretiosum]|uniref:dystroglycan-like isoform X2 n=1 Tax=Trichogramma pretiosum TaxID=7493 RepID=UPI0006C974D8|nr:dystroglycan-like isoform X2 [Trichogramma pretiosum]
MRAKMKGSSPAVVLLLLLLLGLVTGLSLAASYQEDDLVFDDVGDESASPTSSQAEQLEERQHAKEPKKWLRVEKLLGMPDIAATVGKVFKLHVPKQAFSGNVDYYEARGVNNRGLPHWLRWDEPASALYGVPSRRDVGRHRVTIRAVGSRGDSAQDSFYIHVVPTKNDHFAHKDGKKRCSDDQDRTLLTIMLDAQYDSLKPQAKVNAIENVAGFYGVPANSLTILPDAGKDSPVPSRGSSIVLSGPGSSKRREKYSTAVQWQVGCDGHFWPHQIDTIKQIPEHARDGTLAEVMELPVYQWRVRNEAADATRSRRQAGAGSGDDVLPDGDGNEYDDENEDEYDDEDADYNEGVTAAPRTEKPITQSGVEPKLVIDEHPHRHHHGDENIAAIGSGVNHEDDFIWRGPEINNSLFDKTNTTSSASVTNTEKTKDSSGSPSTSVTVSMSSENPTEKTVQSSQIPIDNYNISAFDSSSTQQPTLSTSTSTVALTTSTREPSTTSSTTTTTEATTTTTSTTMPEPSTPSSTTTTTTTTTTEEPSTTSTTPSTTTTTTTSTTTTLRTTESFYPRIRNMAPKVERRLKKIPITQGKSLSYTIPEDTFSDPEDGNTRKLSLRVTEKGAPLKPSHWLQFNERTQEIYGLPLEEHYGTYLFEVEASDSEGLTASDKLDISVQQHKQTRAINHEFTLYLKIVKRSDFPKNVDWQLEVMRNLAQLYGDKDLSYITVRAIDINNDQAIYTWTNDSLIRTSDCPHEEINKLHQMLISKENSEEPSDNLISVLGPKIIPKRVEYQGLEQCQKTKETKFNEYPVPRNQIDRLNATAGQLFVYRVPKDTFFDEEDGDTRSMKATLLTASRTEIPSSDWLQFDSSNQEFYGVPMDQDVGQKTYQLVVKDSEGLEATDSLVAEVHSAPFYRHPLQISMVLNMPRNDFAHSALKKRIFVEKLQKVYGDRDTSAISLVEMHGNNDGTTISWRNITLPTHECPHDEIARLTNVIATDHNGEKNFTAAFKREFQNGQQPDFIVSQVTFKLRGVCEKQIYGSPEKPPIDDSRSVGAKHDDLYITYVLPAVIIGSMFALAGIIACILYKRKRSGKMSISEKDEERQSFRSRGIPVIFQDELDEKPDPGNKSPIILKEEKPPLPPPEYQRAEDGADIPMLSKENSEEPYQPPPPFATNRDSNRLNRPKPTPTYRKPPPYVPP